MSCEGARDFLRKCGKSVFELSDSMKGRTHVALPSLILRYTLLLLDVRGPFRLHSFYGGIPKDSGQNRPEKSSTLENAPRSP